MNPVGKIFTVLIFVVSLVFMTFSTMIYMTHKNWMAAVVDPKTGLDQQLKTRKAENEGLKVDNERLNKAIETEKLRHRNDLVKLEGENKDLREERTKNEKILATKDATIRDAAAAMLAAQGQLKDLRDRIARLELDIKAANAERNAKLKELVRLTDELHNAVNERVAVEKRNVDLLKELSETRRGQ